jgi:hypothetical protein
MRFRIEPRDVPPEVAARRLGKTFAEFNAALPGLVARGFPQADPTTGNFDLAAIDRWCARRPGSFRLPGARGSTSSDWPQNFSQRSPGTVCPLRSRQLSVIGRDLVSMTSISSQSWLTHDRGAVRDAASNHSAQLLIRGRAMTPNKRNVRIVRIRLPGPPMRRRATRQENWQRNRVGYQRRRRDEMAV